MSPHCAAPATAGQEDGVFDLGQDIGGANVMTIEQGS